MTKYIIPVLKGNMIIIPSEKIKYFRSDGPVVYVTDVDENNIASGHTLRFFHEIVQGDSFFQISQSIIVNLLWIRMIDVTNQEVELLCGKRLTMSRSGLKNLKEHIKLSHYRLAVSNPTY